MNSNDIAVRLFGWLAIVILIGVVKLRPPRRIPTILGYVLVVVTSLMLGRYIGIAETMMRIPYLHF
jgi:hypothetical protein